MKWCVLKCFAFFGLALNAAGYLQKEQELIKYDECGEGCTKLDFGEFLQQELIKYDECGEGCTKLDFGEILHVNTHSGLPYKFFPVSSQFIQFRVRASYDAHIALTFGPRNSNPMVEVFIGGKENNSSAIRKNETEPYKVVVQTHDILNSNEYRGFWLHWDDGLISVGREGQPAPFLSWRDPEPFPIHFIGLGSSIGWGDSSASWKIQGLNANVANDFGPCINTQDAERCDNYCGDFSRIGDCIKAKCECIRPNSKTGGQIYVATGNDLHYEIYPLQTEVVHFKVRAPNDAHIILTSGPQKSQPKVEIFIGGWQNNQSAIRENDIEPDKVLVDTPGILHGNKYRGFWLTWSDDIISVGREDQSIPFMSWKKSKPFPISFIGFRTGWGASGSWIIQGSWYVGGATTQDTALCNSYCRDFNRFGDCDDGICKCPRSKKTSNGTLSVVTDPEFPYQFFPVSSKKVHFKVKAPNDAYIVLTSGPNKSKPMIEILIGGWFNTQSVIEKNGIEPFKVTVATHAFLNSNEYRSFWLQWDDNAAATGSITVAVGRAGHTFPFMSWEDPEPFPINFIGLRTHENGSWEIQY